jgi:selenocysteine lyase/cysteine desulfurase
VTRVAPFPGGVRSGVIGAGLALVAAPPDTEEEINLDYAATTPALQAALDAVLAFVPTYGSVHRGGGRRSTISTERYEAARLSVGAFVGAPPGATTVFVRNTTEAANLLAAALPPGAHVLCTPFEHHANLLPWRVHTVTHLPFTSSGVELVDAVDEVLGRSRAAGRPVSLVAVSGASNVTGEVTPIDELATVAHRYDAAIFVDAAQLAPHRRIDMRVPRSTSSPSQATRSMRRSARGRWSPRGKRSRGDSRS